MSERIDIACDCCAAPIGQRCAPDCQSRDDDDAAEIEALGHRVAYLESELARIRPVYEAAEKVAAHRKLEAVDHEAWNRERVRLAEALDEVLDRARAAETASDLTSLAEAVVASQPAEQTTEQIREWAERLAADICAPDDRARAQR